MGEEAHFLGEVCISNLQARFILVSVDTSPLTWMDFDLRKRLKDLFIKQFFFMAFNT